MPYGHGLSVLKDKISGHDLATLETFYTNAALPPSGTDFAFSMAAGVSAKSASPEVACKRKVHHDGLCLGSLYQLWCR